MGKGCEDRGKEERGVRIGVAALCAANVHHVVLLGDLHVHFPIYSAVQLRHTCVNDMTSCNSPPPPPHTHPCKH